MLILLWEVFYMQPVKKKSILRGCDETAQQGICDEFVWMSSHTNGCSGPAVTGGPRQETVSLIRHMAVLMPCARNMTKNSEEDTVSR